MSVIEVHVEPEKPKVLYNVVVRRGKDDIRWWSKGASRIEVTWKDPSCNLAINHRDPKCPIFKAARHPDELTSPLKLKYTITVHYPSSSTPLTIDPEVIIQP